MFTVWGECSEEHLNIKKNKKDFNETRENTVKEGMVWHKETTQSRWPPAVIMCEFVSSFHTSKQEVMDTHLKLSGHLSCGAKSDPLLFSFFQDALVTQENNETLMLDTYCVRIINPAVLNTKHKASCSEGKRLTSDLKGNSSCFFLACVLHFQTVIRVSWWRCEARFLSKIGTNDLIIFNETTTYHPFLKVCG